MKAKSTGEELFAFQCKVARLDPQPVREHWFARDIGRRWRFDFAWPEQLIAVEVEGGEFTQGRHVRPLGFRQDCEKYLYALCRGWAVARVTTEMVKSGQAIRGAMRVLELSGWHGVQAESRGAAPWTSTCQGR